MLKKIALWSTLLFGLLLSNANANDNIRKYGSDDAPVKIEEFSSLTCPFCAKVHKDIYPELVEKYVKTDKVQIIYRNFPLDNVAMAASMLGLSIQPKKYFAYLQYAYNNQAELIKQPRQTLYKWGILIGFDKNKVNTILKDNKLLKTIKSDMKVAGDYYNITGTPTILINGERYEGKFTTEEFFAAVEEELK